MYIRIIRIYTHTYVHMLKYVSILCHTESHLSADYTIITHADCTHYFAHQINLQLWDHIQFYNFTVHSSSVDDDVQVVEVFQRYLISWKSVKGVIFGFDIMAYHTLSFINLYLLYSVSPCMQINCLNLSTIKELILYSLLHTRIETHVKLIKAKLAENII